MKLPVYMYGQPVLRQKTRPVQKPADRAEADRFKSLIADMFETMYHSEGVGLAAPQVGLDIALVVIDGSPVAENFAECKDSRMVLVNPRVTVLDGETVSRDEGCLSLPGIAEKVKRTEHIRLEWQDGDFEEHSAEFDGFLSRIIQHECDHLEGHVFIDHISPIRRQLIKRSLNNIIEGKVRTDYPARFVRRR